MTYYEVAEAFVSINGEGTKAGQLAVFIRFRGCNLACSYCDTVWANSEAAPSLLMTAEDIYRYIRESGVKNVTLTGGEPLKQKNIDELLLLLGKDDKLFVEVETNGSIPLSGFVAIKNRPSFTMDYKLPGSGMESYMYLPNFEVLGENDTVKFVVGSKEDLHRARNIIENYELIQKCHVYISPVFGAIILSDMVEYMKEYLMNGVTMQLQMHKFIWDPDRRGV